MCNKLRGPVDHPFVGEGGLFFKRHRGPHLMNHDPSFLRLLNLIYLLAHSAFLAVRKFIPLSGSAVTYPPGPPTSSLRKGRVLISSLEVFGFRSRFSSLLLHEPIQGPTKPPMPNSGRVCVLPLIA